MSGTMQFLAGLLTGFVLGYLSWFVTSALINVTTETESYLVLRLPPWLGRCIDWWRENRP